MQTNSIIVFNYIPVVEYISAYLTVQISLIPVDKFICLRLNKNVNLFMMLFIC